MNDLQRYLKNEYRDSEFRLYELMRLRAPKPLRSWVSVAASLAGLCFFIVNFLYWRP